MTHRRIVQFIDHIAYLIIILTLKQSLSLSMLQTLLPGDLPEDEVKRAYTAYALRHRLCAPSVRCSSHRPSAHRNGQRPSVCAK